MKWKPHPAWPRTAVDLALAIAEGRDRTAWLPLHDYLLEMNLPKMAAAALFEMKVTEGKKHQKRFLRVDFLGLASKTKTNSVVAGVILNDGWVAIEATPIWQEAYDEGKDFEDRYDA